VLSAIDIANDDQLFCNVGEALHLIVYIAGVCLVFHFETVGYAKVISNDIPILGSHL
jgi:hypothetical protein